MKRHLRLPVVLTIIILLSAPLAARPNQGPAIGVQAGFLATGIVVDIPLGRLSLNAGVNYPMGFRYIEWAAGDSEDDFDFFPPVFTVTGDVTVPFALGENFDLKVGLSTLAFTDFETGMFGVIGGAVKGEYWIPNKDMGLFVNLNVPAAFYIITEDNQGMVFHPLIALAGVFTTTAGVLWTF